MDDRLITVAIHTFDRAHELKVLLEREGLEVTLHNVNLNHPVVSSGIRVRIKESDLPLALRIIENQEIFTLDNAEKDKSDHILVPVDFSSYSDKACQVALKLAEKLKANIHLLHTYSDPSYNSSIQLSAVFSFDSANNDPDVKLAVETEARRQMDLLSSSLLARMKFGELPVVKVTTEIREGIPEELINQYAKEQAPLMIVMGTRGANTKERELVGSVTAEVLDTCRYPVFTVPDTVDLNSFSRLDSVLFFSNFDQEDILALDELFRLLPVEHVNVILVRIPGKKSTDEMTDESLRRLEAYCTVHYPAHRFSVDSLSVNTIEDDFHRLTNASRGKLIAVPNKKKNIFARLFNPGIAHRILFHSDTPMMVIPV